MKRFFLDSADTQVWEWNGNCYVINTDNTAYEQGLPEHNCDECPSYCGAGLEEVEGMIKRA